MKRLVFCALVCSSLAVANAGFCQTDLSATNRLEYRRASQGEETLDNWLDADVWFGQTRVGFRLEVHQSAPATSREQLSQRYLEYRSGALRLRVGNFYEKIGQGLLFQSFEIQRMTLERIERSFVLDRNADGLWLEYAGSLAELRLFSARPLLPFAPERQDVVRGADATLRLPAQLSLGFSAVNWSPPRGPRSELRAGRFEWLPGPLAVSTEYAWRLGRADEGEKPRALYAAVDASLGRAAVSFQYKDYRSFDLPFNRPPVLVPTHPISLLNRHTHLVQADDEKGFQFQLTWSPADAWTLVLNANAGSDHAGSEDSRYREVFADLRYESLGNWACRFTLDVGREALFNERDRRTAVVEVEKYLPGGWSAFADLQLQRIQPLVGERYTNALFTLSAGRSPDLSVAAQLDYSSAPTESRRWFPAAVLVYTFQERHVLTLTVGRRRKGLMCAGGLCTLVPEFSGVELRLTSRL